ncbi:hypothetical protein FA95DRAFT_1610223 [Auriscalpium vulgare]|uniref:Uncharacterized protein n=1 Tax=Auriscalpium vulgare TaxID=40419 RepID=A0ACB8RE50_9AGAM|nr:hypothetical protein FA95DRAFT_1610223 [Auriscalpium vulgare]
MGVEPSIANTLGPIVLGFGASSIVFGLLCIQVWQYFQRYPKDRLGYKILVSWLWIAEAAHQALIGHCLWYYTVTNYGRMDLLPEPPVWSLSIQIVVGAIIGTVVKICFGLRVWKLSRNYILTGIIVAMAIGQLGTAAVYTIRANNTRLDQAHTIKPIGIASLALGAATDIFTAAALSFSLNKKRTGFPTSNTVINRLILYAVNNGFVTSVCSIAVVLLYDFMPDNTVYVGTYFILSKLYGNSCVATLNSRRFVRGRGTDHESKLSFIMATPVYPNSDSIKRPSPLTIQTAGIPLHQGYMTSPQSGTRTPEGYLPTRPLVSYAG